MLANFRGFGVGCDAELDPEQNVADGFCGVPPWRSDHRVVHEIAGLCPDCCAHSDAAILDVARCGGDGGQGVSADTMYVAPKLDAAAAASVMIAAIAPGTGQYIPRTPSPLY